MGVRGRVRAGRLCVQVPEGLSGKQVFSPDGAETIGWLCKGRNLDPITRYAQLNLE